jgi:integrase
VGQEDPGKLHDFGPWSDPDDALAKYLEQKEALHAGRKPRPDAGALTVKDVANAFLNHKRERTESGELAPRTWQEYKATCDLVVGHFGKGRAGDLAPEDFAELRNRVAERLGPVAPGNAIQRVRCVFKFAYEAGLLPAPVRFGPGFARPSKKVIRLHRAKQGPKLFTAREVRRLIGIAGPALKAMVLLGVNCGFGNADCGNLPRAALDLDGGWVDFPRPKTGIPRRCALWPETVQALRDYVAVRPEPKRAEDAELVFITKYGLSWSKDTPGGPVSQESGKLLRPLRINGRNGLGLYTLRHTFRTVADEAKDQPAADFIVGHESSHSPLTTASASATSA